MKKYELTGNAIVVNGIILYRIRALKAFHCVVFGEMGGFVQDEENLSHDGECWIESEAKVYMDARVSGNARVSGDAEVYGNAKISGSAIVSGYAKVFGDTHIYGHSRISIGEYGSS